MSKDGKDTDRPDTRLQQLGRRPEWTGRVVNPPIWRASTVLYPDTAAIKEGVKTNRDGDWFYGRRGTPTQWALAEAMTELEPGAAGTMLYPSGVAAIAGALLSVLKPGDELLMVDNAYDPSRMLADGLLKTMGISTRYFDPMIGSGLADEISDTTRAILLESPGSLTFEVPDLEAMVSAAKARDVSVLLDNTWATPLYLQAIPKGVDLSIVAITKYVGGHSDLMMGSVTANEAHWLALRKTAQALGQYVSPDDAALALRGLRTLGTRLRQHQDSGLAVAHHLEAHPVVEAVLHPALPNCPGHQNWKRDFTGATGLFAFTLKSGGAEERAKVIDALRLFGIGYSWGGFESLAVPADMDGKRSATKWSAPGRTIRLHIGLEDPADLIADLDQALALIG